MTDAPGTSSVDAAGWDGPLPFVLGGMARSGTSALARLLMSAGLDVGERLMAPSEHNRLGYYEDLSVLEVNAALLEHAAVPGVDPGMVAWSFAERLSLQRAEPDLVRRLGELLRTRAAATTGPWGFKDPRSTLLLDVFAALVPGAPHLFSYRPPWDVVGSLMRLSGRPFTGQGELAVRAWLVYNRSILDWVGAHPGRAGLVHVQALARAPDRVLKLADGLLGAAGAPLLPGRPDPSAQWDPGLLTTLSPDDPLPELMRAFRPEVMEVWAELEALADLSAADVARAQPGLARVQRARDAARPPALAVVRVLPEGDTAASLAGSEDTEAVDVEPVAGPGSIAAAAAAGVAKTQASLLCLLLPGAELGPEALGQARRTCAERDAPALLLLAYRPAGATAAVRREDRGAPALVEDTERFGGVLLDRELWDTLGGFDADLPAWADHVWALGIAAGAQGRSVSVLLDALAPAAHAPAGVDVAEARLRVLQTHASFALDVMSTRRAATNARGAAILAERDGLREERDTLLRELEAERAHREAALADMARQRDVAVEQRDLHVGERDALLGALGAEREHKAAELADLARQRDAALELRDHHLAEQRRLQDILAGPERAR